MLQNAVVIISIVLVILLCLTVGYWLLVRPLRQLQMSTRDMQTLLSSTQNTLAQAQQETAALRRALTATSIQGQWGEMQLQRIVELAGMLPYCDFETQVTVSGVKGNQRPDLLVKLSNGRTIVVDAKAPVDTYVQAYETLDENKRMMHLRRYAKRVRDHVMILAKREYWRNFEPSPEWVVLFLPNEGMFRAALEYDPMLLDESLQQRVLLASPITLVALLKAMAYSWQQEKRAKNVQQAIEYSQALQRELVTFVGQWRMLQKELTRTTHTFNQCIAMYQENVLPIIQKMYGLDGTINPDQYDLANIPPFPVLQSVEDAPIHVKEAAEVKVITLSQITKDDALQEG